MSDPKDRYYHAQANRVDPRRRWQLMAAWPLVHRFGRHVKMEFEYVHGMSRIDLYIPELKLAVEVDEPFHDQQQEADEARQEKIARELGCDFYRIKIRHPEDAGIFDQVDDLIGEVERRISVAKVTPWQPVVKRAPTVRPTRDGGYSEANLRLLEDNKIPALVEEMVQELTALDMEVTDDLGPVVPSNAELGFTVVLPGMRFAVSVRPNRTAKLLVTRYEQKALMRLGVTLDGPKKGKVSYWNIQEFKGRYTPEAVIETLADYSRVLGT